jgi:predicted RNase H-like HicB family nuclease
MKFTIEIEREDDGRWIAEVPALSGVLCYGQTREEAVAHVQALALRVIAERLEHGETPAELLNVSFESVERERSQHKQGYSGAGPGEHDIILPLGRASRGHAALPETSRWHSGTAKIATTPASPAAFCRGP